MKGGFLDRLCSQKGRGADWVLCSLHLTSSRFSHSIWLSCSAVVFLCSHGISDLLIGVEHHAHGGTNGTGRQVLGEVSANQTGVSVGGDHLAPDGLVGGVGLRVVLAVDVGDAFAVVPGGVRARLHTLESQESLSLVLGALTAFEALEGSFHVKFDRL